MNHDSIEFYRSTGNTSTCNTHQLKICLKHALHYQTKNVKKNFRIGYIKSKLASVCFKNYFTSKLLRNLNFCLICRVDGQNVIFFLLICRDVATIFAKHILDKKRECLLVP
jgi:hypothetical protein